MAKKTSGKPKPTAKPKQEITIILHEPYQLRTTYAPKVLVPHEAIDRSFFEVLCKNEADFEAWLNAKFATRDGKYARVHFISGYNNSDGRYNGELDRICKRLYGYPFSQVRSIWMARRNGYISDFWHLLELEEWN